MSPKLTVLGAGVAGLAVASECRARGADVTLIDPAGCVGAHGCSWWAGGMLAPICEGVRAEPEIVAHGCLAADWWENQGVEVKRNGTLVVALGRDQNELRRFARRAPGSKIIDQDAIRALEPALAERFSQAIFIEEEAHLDPRAALLTLQESLKQAGCPIVTSVSRQERVVDCRGLAAREDLPNLRGVRGEMLVLRCPDISFTRPIRLLHPRFPLYIVPRADHVFMLGASELESGARSPAKLRSISELINAAYALHPAFAEAELLEIGADARPAFPDNQPRIVQTPHAIYVNGLFRHGFLLAPALAQMLAGLIFDTKKPELWYETHCEW